MRCPSSRPIPLWRRFLRQFESPLIYILIFALAFDLGLWAYEGLRGWPVDAVAIASILLLNAALGLYQEQRSEAALARLKAMSAAHAWVLRDGQLVRLPSSELVPGDWVRLEAGDRVPADGTLRDEHGAMLDESVLTGESVPVEKTVGRRGVQRHAAGPRPRLSRGHAHGSVERDGAAGAHPRRDRDHPHAARAARRRARPSDRAVGRSAWPSRSVCSACWRKVRATPASCSSSRWRSPWPRCPRDCPPCSPSRWRWASNAW